MSSTMAKKRKLRSSESAAAQTPLQYVPVEYHPPQEDEEQEQEDHNQNEEEEDNEQNMDQSNNGSEQEEDEEEEEEENKNEQPSTELNNNGDVKQEEEEYVEEPVEKLLEPFGKDQLILLVKEAVAKHPDLMDIVQKLADADPAHRKVFVHGLGWDTTAETITPVFSKYGEIEDCKVVVDKISGKSKGYAFILYKHRLGAKKALQQPQKQIGTRLTSCQLASAGPVQAPPPTVAAAPPVSEYTQRKIFVSNVSADVEPKKLVDFFAQFGEIEEGPLGIDKQTGKFKGFCLFVYRSVEGAKKALEEPHKQFEGTTLHCQKAVDGPKHSKPQHQQQQQQHHGFRKERRPYGGGGGHGGHMMAPSGGGPSSGGYNAAAAGPNLAPVLGQALTALLAGQGAAGIGNLLGGLQQPGMNSQGGYSQGVYNQQGYNQQPQGGGYGVPPQPGMQGGHQMGGGAGRPPPGGGPYMGHGR